MVRVHTHIILLQVEGVVASGNGAELVVVLEVWPAPQAAVDHMGKSLAMRHLQMLEPS